MTIWGKVIGGFAGFALGGPLGGLLGAVAGHAVDKMRGEPGSTTGNDSKQVAFTVGVIVLSAKMAKADGQVTREEVDVFKRLFRIPASEMSEVGKIFDQAKREASGFEPYAQQIADMFRHQPRLLEELLDGLFHIAKADGVVTGDELAYLHQVARIFRFDDHEFERIRQGHMPRDEADPYEVLGVTRQSSDDEIKSAYRKLIRETHPDVLIAQGLPQEFIDLANQKMATINAAYDQVSKERKL